MGSEARKTKRIDVSIPAAIFLKDKPNQRIDAEVINISEGGAFVHCTTPIKIGQEIFLEILFAETKMLAAKVTKLNDDLQGNLPEVRQEKSVVRWVRGSSSSGFGVEFVNIQSDNKTFVQRLYNYFESLGKAGVIFEDKEQK